MAKTTSPTKRKAVIKKAKVFRSKQYWYYTLVGDNGKVLNCSEPMARRRSCVEVCKKYFPDFKIVFE